MILQMLHAFDRFTDQTVSTVSSENEDDGYTDVADYSYFSIDSSDQTVSTASSENEDDGYTDVAGYPTCSQFH